MGLFNRIKDPVQGTARVVNISTPSGGNASMENAHLELAVTAPGIDPVTVTHQCLVHADKWPHAGDSLPVTVDRGNPKRLKIDWDAVPSGRAGGQAQAEATADALRRQGLGDPTAAPSPGPAQQAAGAMPDLSQLPPQAREVVEQLEHMFPGAQFQVQSNSKLVAGQDVASIMDAVTNMSKLQAQGGLPVPQAAPSAEEDEVAQLERLARLHEQGALTDEEFAAAKKRVMEG